MQDEVYESHWAFNAFMAGWKKRDWTQARSAMQITANVFGYDEKALRDLLGQVRLKSWQITETREVTPVVQDVMTDVTFDINGIALEKRLTVRVVKELAAFTPDERGTWGVAPLSVLTTRDREDAIV